jgi:hypothetical protein
MTKQQLTAVPGDVNDLRVFRLDGVENLDAVQTVTGRVIAHPVEEGEVVAVLTATVVDPEARTVEVNLGGVGGWLPTAEEGEYALQFRLVFNDGTTTLTWPATAPFRLTVRKTF